MISNATIVSRIREARMKAKMTQEQIADALGINRITYMNIEANRSPLSINTLNEICEILNIEPIGVIESSEPKDDYDEEKFVQLYYYILKKHFSDTGVTKTKLAKLLYLSDFTYYYCYNESITGASYYRNHYGPLAKDFLAITDDQFKKGKISIRIFDLAQIISISDTNGDFDPEVFTEKEKNIIDMVCNYWKDKNTSEIVNFTHSQKAWQERRDGEYIPYQTIKKEPTNNVFAPVNLPAY